MHNRYRRILVTGASGYIGVRLVARLLEAGYHVRALSRSLEKLKGLPWAAHPNVELVAQDVLDQHGLRQALEGCEAVYYLIHSMNPQHKNFVQADRTAAQNLADAAQLAGIQRIIYLGGLGEDAKDLSKHLHSRAEVASILQRGAVPVTVFRAAMIIGSGSASFEILRYLVEHLPIMITPRWVRTPSQPISIRNVLHYLVHCLNKEETAGRVFDIGGPEKLTYQELMDTYAAEAGLTKRLVVPLPFFTPRLSSYWIHLVTPVPAYIARPLAEGLRNPAVCREDSIQDLLPQELLDCKTAIKLALERIQMQDVESHWTDAGVVPPEWRTDGDPGWAEGTVYEDSRSVETDVSPAQLWQPIVRLGGKTGWYYGDWLWQLRGLMDRIIGGVGLLRGRRHSSDLKAGDALDWWRVILVDKEKRLVMVAEMKLPGKATLEFTIEELAGNRSKLTQTARFLPSGLMGLLYWWAVTPLHNVVFGGMLKGIAQTASCGKDNSLDSYSLRASNDSGLRYH